MYSYTLLIVPAVTDQAGQCRIVVAEFDVRPDSALNAYRCDPDCWREIGLMNSRGKLVCLDAPREVWDDLKDCEPLMAGSQFTYDLDAPWECQAPGRTPSRPGQPA